MKVKTFLSLFIKLLLVFTLSWNTGYPKYKGKSMSKIELDSLNTLDSLVNRYRFTNTSLAKKYAIKALKFSLLKQSENGEARSYILLGLTYLQINTDSSLFYFDKAQNIAIEYNDNEVLAHGYYCQASLYKNVYDYKTAVVLLDSSLKYAKTVKDYVVIADVCNLLGNIRKDLNDFIQAKDLYLNSFQIARANGLNRQCGIALVNLASLTNNNLEAMSKLSSAINYFRNSNGCDEELSSTYINMGNRQSNPDSALIFLKQGLKISIKGKILLSEIGAYNIMTYCYLDKGDLRNAETCIRDKAIPIALSLKNEDWLATLYDSYTDVLLKKEDFKLAALYAKKSLNSRVEADRQFASNQVRLLASLLDLKNKELLIKDREQQLFRERLKVREFRLWFFIAVLMLLIAIATVLWIHHRGEMKLQKEQIASAKRIIELDEREKSTVARDLHDLTGQMQIALLHCFDNIQLEDRAILDNTRARINEVTAITRRLSHRLNSHMVGKSGIRGLITDLCEDIEKITDLKIILEIDLLVPISQETTCYHTYRIIQELLSNAAKYISDGEIVLHLLVEKNLIMISYSDSGPGFNIEAPADGMGLINIHERVKLLKGQVDLKSSLTSGTSWEITFPNHSNS